MANIIKRGDTYTIRVSAGMDSNSKQIRKNMTFTPPKGMTEKQADKEDRKMPPITKPFIKSDKAKT